MAKRRFKKRKKGKGSYKKLRRTTKKPLSKAAVDRAQSRAILANKKFLDSLKPPIKVAGQLQGMTAAADTVVAVLNGQSTLQTTIFHETIGVGHLDNTRLSPTIKPFHFQLNLMLNNTAASTVHGVHVTLAMVNLASFSVASNFTYKSHSMYYDYNVATQQAVNKIQLLPKYRASHDAPDTAGQQKKNQARILYNKFHHIGYDGDGVSANSKFRVMKFNIKLRGKWVWPTLATTSENLITGWVPVLFLISENAAVKFAFRSRIYWTE